MARRRQKNSLLPRMIGIAVIVNAILIPILAQFGVFKGAKGRHDEMVKLVNLPPPQKKPEQKRNAVKKHVAKARPHAPSHTAARPAPSRPSRPNPNQPKVVASSSPSGSGSGPAIDNSGTGAPGQLPSGPPTPPPPVQPAPPPVTPPAPTPPVQPTPPATTPPPTPPPHVPVLVEAQPIDQPRPTIPDDLSYDDIKSNFEALFTISASGAVSVKMVNSTGDGILDSLALDAARHWTFRPATEDGKPVDSYRRLTIEFYPT